MPPSNGVPSGRARGVALGAAVGVALLALALARVLAGFEPRLEHGTAALSSLLAGAAQGRVVEQAVLRLPGLDRRPPRALVLHGASADGTAATLFVAIDGGAPQPVRLGLSSPGLVALPAALTPGARVSLRSPDGAVVLSRIEIQPAPRAVVLAGPSRRRPVAHAAGLATLLALGVWARLFFLPSTGSWDTDYWKAWMLRTVDRGLARAYGEPAPIDLGRMRAELGGEAPIFQPEFEGRRFVIDQPPLNLSLLAGAHAAIAWLDPPLGRLEALNVAVKLPPVLADVATLGALVLILRRRPLRAASPG